MLPGRGVAGKERTRGDGEPKNAGTIRRSQRGQGRERLPPKDVLSGRGIPQFAGEFKFEGRYSKKRCIYASTTRTPRLRGVQRSLIERSLTTKAY
jgi:hypothetical protein